MFQRYIIAALVPIAVLTGAAYAQTDPGVPNRGLAVRILPGSTKARIVRYEYNGPVAFVRIEASEPGAPRNQHPYTVDTAHIRAALLAVRLPSEKNGPLFNDAELDEISPPLSRALAQAADNQDVCFAVSGRHGAFAPLSPRRVTTARVFRADGHLNLVFGMVRHDWDNEFKGTGTVIPFEPGRRAGPIRDEPSVALDPALGAARRGDWLALGDLDSLAPATTASPSTPTAAPTAPATPTPAPAAAPAEPAGPERSAPPATRPSYEVISQRLRALQKLRDEGLITQQEYEEKRKEILKDL